MRTLYALLFLLFLTNTFGQIVIDKTVKQQYDSVYITLADTPRQNIEELEKFVLKSYNELSNELKKHFPYSPLNVAVVTFHHIDTLNKNEVKPDAYFHQVEKYPVLFCKGGMVSDSVIIILYSGEELSASVDITHKIIGGKVYSEYHEWEKYDTSFRTNLHEKKTNALILPVTVDKFVLSDTNFVVGKTIYGYAEVKTNPYYQGSGDFKKDYIERQLSFRYYFKFEVQKNST